MSGRNVARTTVARSWESLSQTSFRRDEQTACHFDFHFEKRSAATLSWRRGVLRKTVWDATLGIAPAENPFLIRGPYGKAITWRLRSPKQPIELKFNLAHFGWGCRLYGFTGLGEIGIDPRAPQNRNSTGADIARRFFSVTEVASLDLIPLTERALAFFQLLDAPRKLSSRPKGIGFVRWLWISLM